MKENVKILVVDDEAIMRNLLLKILEQEGYQVRLTSSAQEALEKLNDERFEIVLVDVKMPQMSGFELLEKINKQWPQVAVIMMTGFGDAHSIKQALLSGADEYITKPFKSHEISLIVERTFWRMRASNRQHLDKSKINEQS